MLKRLSSYALVLLTTIIFTSILQPLPLLQTEAAPLSQAGCVIFQETHHTLCGRFFQYWNEHGGLAQQGYPISDVLGETSPTDGKVYTIQYFERAVFEYHPENPIPNDVLLSLLGTFRYSAKYPNGAPGQQIDTSPGAAKFNETGHTIGGVFFTYWQQHGGLAQQGFPISDEFQEKSDLNGNTYLVQYFERAVFEMHPENPTATRVLLSQLGTFRYQATYGSVAPTLAPPVSVPPAIPEAPPAQPASGPPAQPTPVPQPTPIPRASGVTIVSPPGSVGRGYTASVTARTSPNTSCSIDVEYKSGSSTAAGLYDKTSDGSGFVSWSWKVGTRTTPGSWPVYITCGGATATTFVTVP